eukprot:2246483-Amphidinium_carterae.1
MQSPYKFRISSFLLRLELERSSHVCGFLSLRRPCPAFFWLQAYLYSRRIACDKAYLFPNRRKWLFSHGSSHGLITSRALHNFNF